MRKIIEVFKIIGYLCVLAVSGISFFILATTLFIISIVTVEK